MKRAAFLALAGMAAAAWGAAAEWEHTGRMVDTGGKALTGERMLEVRLYGGMAETQVLWGRKAKALLDAEGNFSLRLSDDLEPLEDSPEDSLESVLAAGPVYAEATVEGHPTAAPRAALAATPYAMCAEGAEGAEGDFSVLQDLTVEGKTSVPSFRAATANAQGPLTVTEKLTVGGNLTAGGGIKAPGLGPVPVGTIVLFYGTDVPDGWALCDGTGGTPDLRGRFVVGAGKNYALCSTGGVETVTLDVSNLPEHAHGYSLPGVAGGGDFSATLLVAQSAGTTATAGPNGEQPDGGFGQAHDNLPPFFALDYIMRVD
ncbi:MAG: hypothetical protein IK066_07445 [Kiritimatiellae bacterium]|nr:hypothetical protein [Kiritimatiellia bacterium]